MGGIAGRVAQIYEPLWGLRRRASFSTSATLSLRLSERAVASRWGLSLSSAAQFSRGHMNLLRPHLRAAPTCHPLFAGHDAF